MLVDDCVLVEPWVGLRPWVSSEVFEDGVRNKTSQTVWGVIMETDTERAALPERRIQKGAVLLTEEGFDHGSTSLNLKKFQQFRGIMTGWSAILSGLVNELKAADKFLGGLDGSAPIKVNLKGDGSRRWEEQNAWQDLWDLFEVCRWLSARTDQWDLLFSTTLKEMLPPLERMNLPGEWEGVVFVSSDVTTVTMGAIDWKHGAVFREHINVLRPWIERVLTDKELQEEAEGLVIHLCG